MWGSSVCETHNFISVLDTNFGLMAHVQFDFKSPEISLKKAGGRKVLLLQ